MITVLITENEAKIKAMLMQILQKQGYAFAPDAPVVESVVQVLSSEEANRLSLKEKIGEIGDALLHEKKGQLYKSILAIIEKPLLEHVLARTEGNQLKAARILGINRNTIRAKIKKLGINTGEWKNA
ncbi:MAG TPA: helix-turn-helix domain-containing protein [Candidatus Omnitrophota bacterium]|nr:helix-turn-helix domain-containing protein [Candidatus Omnitrophota bacterium]HRZ14567.1 helix-turn-helix domain-containing protein [Candidatus Omnitrophota bacterium]